ncbi:response regulator transcription factor [Chitinophaga sedimenti]|uniref:response regulator n=1 Tax=Chitinophaga sedimenti TaxID=2033606 RepID=UPI0020036171|nr:response regulator transcription factor [Chitinophaga sedimenti]MCK7558064.1 response regulator transcription factor [Chitinophaga sedimenti]
MKNIIVIEDNPVIREGFAAVIDSSTEYRISGQYGSCEEALKNLQTDQPDLVLMDIELPGMSGIEGITQVKKRLPACIILIITVHEDSEKVFRSLCAGAGGTSSKIPIPGPS